MTAPEFPPFEPHPLLRGPHAQTLAGVYLPCQLPHYRAVQRLVVLDDGDQLVLHDDRPACWQAGGRVALLMHGLCGSHHSGYMRRIAHKLSGRGVRTFRLDLRGCGAGAALARLPYHSGRSDDAAAALRAIAELCPGSPVTLAGFSLSGNITLKLLGERDTTTLPNLDSAVAVCPPINLDACCQMLESGLPRSYDRYFARQLWRQIKQLRLRVADPPNVAIARRPRGIRHFDDVYTAPVSGFGNAANYYELCSSAQFVPNIRLPTLILASRDDPMIRAADFDALDLPPSVHLCISKHGGHLGFIARPGIDPDRRWLDWRVVDWVTAQGNGGSSPGSARLPLHTPGDRIDSTT